MAVYRNPLKVAHEFSQVTKNSAFSVSETRAGVR